jgi:hypothetical protein
MSRCWDGQQRERRPPPPPPPLFAKGLKLITEKYLKSLGSLKAWVNTGRHKVHIYLEYHNICLLAGIGPPPPTPSPASKFAPPPGTKGVCTVQWCTVHTRLRVRGGGGVPIPTIGEKA